MPLDVIPAREITPEMSVCTLASFTATLAPSLCPKTKIRMVSTIGCV